MPEQFLHEQLNIAFDYGAPKPEIPDSITQNLNPTYELRPYQVEAFSRFIHCLNNDFPGKQNPLHLLFNMATGSGKTLIMAGLILYLYEQGYRNFLFFVNADNIIEKTKDNFLNPASSKYLFNSPIYFRGDQVDVTEVENFEGVNENDINIRFATIQKLHSDTLNKFARLLIGVKQKSPPAFTPIIYLHFKEKSNENQMVCIYSNRSNCYNKRYYLSTSNSPIT